MNQVNILDAKTNLSRLIASLENKDYDFITIARNGKPVAKLSLYDEEPHKRIGAAKGLLKYNEDFDRDNDEITAEMEGGNLCDFF